MKSAKLVGGKSLRGTVFLSRRANPQFPSSATTLCVEVLVVVTLTSLLKFCS
jgi:hypothetical protein